VAGYGAQLGIHPIGQKKTVEYFPHSSHSITLLVD